MCAAARRARSVMAVRFPACRRCAPTRGLALLVVLLLVALLGLAGTAAVEVADTLARRDREEALLQIGREFRTAILRHRAALPMPGAAQDPQTLDALIRDRRVPGTLRHLRRIYVDPMTGKAEWGLVRERGRIVGVHSLSTGKPLKQAGFGPAEADFARARQYSDWVFRVPVEGLPVLPPASQPALPGFAPVPMLTPPPPAGQASTP